MERKGGCLLVPRYGGSGVGGQAPGMSSQMGRILLKFRPIAPKPAAMAPAPTPAPVAAAAGRGKRKAVGGGGGGGRRGRKPKKAATVAPVSAAPHVAAAQTVGGEKESEKDKSLSSRSSSSSAMTSVDSSPPSPPSPSHRPHQQPATLPLMPMSAVEEKTAEPEAPAQPAGAQPAALPSTAPVVSSWVTVEDVTSTWSDGEAPSAASACGADGEAPAFVSDQWGRVTWANTAFSRAVSDDNSEAAPAVRLAGALPAWGTCAGFTCRVRVRHASPRRGGSVVAPCDVWRLDANGCYLWRLDLQAALTLGGLP